MIRKEVNIGTMEKTLLGNIGMQPGSHRLGRSEARLDQGMVTNT